MKRSMEFVDLLDIRRKDCDILWVSRSMNPLSPHHLPPESKYTRNQIIEEVLTNPQVKSVINFLAAKHGILKFTLAKRARAMINEMASKAHLATVRWIGFAVTKFLKKIFLSIYINEKVLIGLKNQMQISQVQYVYVPSHRSYLDFIVMSYVLFSYDMALPNIASGMDFYNMSIVGEMLRKTGAFYMRRSFFTDILYKEVFCAYIGSILKHDDRAVEFFIEGTRSRSQKSIVPKYGLLSTILESFLKGDVPDIQFIPISISYERPLEELLFVYELLGVPKPKESTAGLFRALSILQNPVSHGHIFFNIAESISVKEFISVTHRKERILNPHYKLPLAVTEDLAYSITESHKRNTVLTGFNIIALLFNERVHMCPGNPYTLEDLTKDYVWCKTFMSKVMNAIVYPAWEEIENDVETEILMSLKPHEELLKFDSLNTLRLKERHKETNLETSIKIKGHSFSQDMMRMAVPAINIAIYINPTFAFLVKPAILTLTIGKNGVKTDEALERYHFIRSLLCTEFVLSPKTDILAIKAEWEEMLTLLLREQCIQTVDTFLTIGRNIKLYYLLHNLILPFIDTVYIICTVLLEWNEHILGVPTEQCVVIQCQKRAEQELLEKGVHCYHPYCLSLDLYKSALSNLETQGIVVSFGKETYRADKISLLLLIAKLKEYLSQRPPGSYFDIIPLSMSQMPVQMQAKM